MDVQVICSVVLSRDDYAFRIGDDEIALHPVLGIVVGGNGDPVTWL